jgi:hypothetical protein
VKKIACLLVALPGTVALAASPTPIGIASASGHFTLEGSSIWGNATLFEGSRVETGAASSQLLLRNGVRVQLAADSAAKVWPDRLVLERGASQITGPGSGGSFEVAAASVKVSGVRFRVGRGERVEVAALSGNARVRSAAGAVLASIPAGSSRAFALFQTVTLVGCLVYKDGGFLLAVEEPQQTMQVVGENLAANVGNRVQAVGTLSGNAPSIAPATQLVNATSITRQSEGGCLTTAAILNASASMPAPSTVAAPKPIPGAAPAPGAGGGGMSTGAKVAIGAAIAGGGAGGVYDITIK